MHQVMVTTWVYMAPELHEVARGLFELGGSKD